MTIERKKFKQIEAVIHTKRVEKQEEDFRRKVDQEKRRIEKLGKETVYMLFTAYGRVRNR